MHGSLTNKKDIPALFEMLQNQFLKMKRKMEKLEQKQEDRYEDLITTMQNLSQKLDSVKKNEATNLWGLIKYKLSKNISL